ncbi:MAG: hypothetical protein AAGJ82_08430, partial [Bacteroidota bacterium]
MNKPLRIGVVGYSANAFDKQAAQKILANCFNRLRKRHPEKRIEIVSGYTSSGVPLIAYELAKQYDFQTVGCSAQQALSVKSGVYPVDKVELHGERFGDESIAFIQSIDGLIRVGGGPQSRREVALFQFWNSGRPLRRLL